MSRTASLDRQQAETILGTRGNLIVNTNNRAEVRKWLSACGVPAVYANSLSHSTLAFAYNDATDAILAEHIRISTGKKTEANAQEARDINEGINSKEQLLNAFQQFIQETAVKPEAAPIDAEAVRQIIKDELAKDENTKIKVVRVIRQDNTQHDIKGHTHPLLAELIAVASSRQENGRHPNVMLCGPTGSGKTHAVQQLAEALGLEFYTNGAISMDHQLVGFKDANGTYHETPFRKAFGRPAVYLFDEIDSSDNSPLLSLAGALANSHHEFPDNCIERHPDSIIIAAGNTWGNGATAEFVGRNKLDGAIRSRFPIRMAWGYDEELERQICGNVDWARRVQKARANAFRAGLKVVIDPRMSQAGAALIANGLTSDRAAELTYLADLTADQRRLVEAA